MRKDSVQVEMEAIETYARYELHALYKGVKMSALAIDEQQRDRVLKVWGTLKAKNVTCVEREAPVLPTWKVSFRTNGRYNMHTLEAQASSPDVIETRLLKIHKHVFNFHAEQVTC